MVLRVGFIGLGTMGKWMAINVARAGFPLVVYDIQSKPIKELSKFGAIPASNPADVARKTDCVLMSLPDTKVVEEVIFGKVGLDKGFQSGSVLVDLSTIDYLATVRIHEKLKVLGVRFIDAPVSGMQERAKEGTLTVMMGGDFKTVKKVRPLIDVIGNNVVYMGKSGNGQLTKLVNQLFFNISVAAMAELLPMAVKLGLDPEALYRVVTNGTGQTFAFQYFTPHILRGDFKQGYPLTNAYKDMLSAAEISDRKKIPLPVFHAALETYRMALSQGLGSESKGAMIKVWEKALEVEVRRENNKVDKP